MKFAVSLNNVYASDKEAVGQRAVDLAELNRNMYKVPLTFVLNSEALEEFVKHNHLTRKGAKLLGEGKHSELQEETAKGQMPKSVMNDIKDAYESLSVGEGDASELVGSTEDHYVTLIPSPNYSLEDGNYTGIFQNVKGIDALTEMIRYAWASLLSRQSFDYRERIGVKEFFAGLIVQKMPKIEASAQAVCRMGEERINVKTWFGFPDYGEGLDKDTFEVSKEHLNIQRHEVMQQSHRFARNEEGNLEKLPLESRGSKQKIDDKKVVEIARQTKKMSNMFGCDVSAVYAVSGENIYLLLSDRLGTQSESEPKVDDTPDPGNNKHVATPGMMESTATTVEALIERSGREMESEDEETYGREEVSMAPESDLDDVPSKEDIKPEMQENISGDEDTEDDTYRPGEPDADDIVEKESHPVEDVQDEDDDLHVEEDIPSFVRNDLDDDESSKDSDDDSFEWDQKQNEFTDESEDDEQVSVDDEDEARETDEDSDDSEEETYFDYSTPEKRIAGDEDEDESQDEQDTYTEEVDDEDLDSEEDEDEYTRGSDDKEDYSSDTDETYDDSEEDEEPERKVYEEETDEDGSDDIPAFQPSQADEHTHEEDSDTEDLDEDSDFEPPLYSRVHEEPGLRKIEDDIDDSEEDDNEDSYADDDYEPQGSDDERAQRIARLKEIVNDLEDSFVGDDNDSFRNKIDELDEEIRRLKESKD